MPRFRRPERPRAFRGKNGTSALWLAACILAIATPHLSADITLVSRLSDARAYADANQTVSSPPPQVQTDFLPAQLSNSASSLPPEGGASAANCTSNSSIALDNSMGTLRVTGDGMAYAESHSIAEAQASAKLIELSFTLTELTRSYSITGQVAAGRCFFNGCGVATAKLIAEDSTIIFLVSAPTFGKTQLSESGTLPPGKYTLSIEIRAPVFGGNFPGNQNRSSANFDFALGPTPTPTPPAGRIVFSRYPYSFVPGTTPTPTPFEERYDIYAMDSNGANLVRLTFAGPEITDKTQPKWSFDGTKIVYVETRLGGPFPNPSYIRVLGQGGDPLGEGQNPTWSPDGTKIAFNFAGNIWVMNANGSNRTDLKQEGFNPSWSPDGTKISFMRIGVGIWVMNADGTNPIGIQQGGGDPEWSPDGTKIAFRSNGDIWVMNADGTNPTRLTIDPAEDFWPSWSAGGLKIVFESFRDGNPQIYTMDADGSNQTRISSNMFPDRQPDWQRDGFVPTPTPTPSAVCGTFSNPGTITIPATGAGGTASPYPSEIVVSGVGGGITKVTVALNGITYSSTADLDVLLVGPGGHNATILSDVGGSNAANGVNLVLDDAAASSLPVGFFGGVLVNGTFRPTNNAECSPGVDALDLFPAPAPSPFQAGSALSAFNRLNPNGTWKLYVVDDRGTGGSISGGWAITVATDNCAGPTATPMPTPTPGGATHFSVVAPDSVSGDFQFTVTARNEANNIVTDYAGTIHFSTEAFPATLPPDSGLTNGTGTFTANFAPFPFGSYAFTATDVARPAITGTSNCFTAQKITPTPPPTPTPTPPPNCKAASFEVITPETATAGVPFSFQVRALCANGFPAAAYFGSVHFTSSDPAAELVDGSLSGGFGSFSATLHTGGSQTITATDFSQASLTGTSNPIVILAPTPSPTATATATPGGAAHAMNLSTRLLVGTGDDVGIGGFIITGTDPKQVLVRGIGPSLGKFGVPNPLADPMLELHGPGTFVTIPNNNWKDTQQAAIEATGIPPTNDLESAILVTLDPGAYTAILRGNNNGTGVGLVELYDLSQGTSSKLANISTRGFVSTGGDIVIAGFILGGGSSNEVILVRGLGPSLTQSGVPNVLADPRLELRNSDGGVIALNYDWQDGLPVSLPPTDPLEAAIERTLSPGAYTALLSGVNDDTGVGLIEIYDRGPATPTPTPIPIHLLPCDSVEKFDNVPAPALPAGWVAANSVGAGPLWITSTSIPDTVPNNVFVADPPTVSDKHLDTPDITIAADATNDRVSFHHSYALDPVDGGADFFDGGVLEVSSPNIAAGAFTDITSPLVGGSFVTGGYNGMISTAFSSPIGGRMAWSQSSNGYIVTTANLGPNVAGQTIKLRFRMCSDSRVSGLGWRIDTVQVLRGTCIKPTPPPCTTVFSETFDKLVPTPTPTPPAFPGWVISTLDPDTPPNVAFCSNPPFTSDSALDFVVSLPSTRAVLRFRNNFNLEANDGIFWDGGVLEVSSPNISGGDFLDITDPAVGGSFVSGGYTGEITDDDSNPLGGRLAWSGDSNGYIDTVVNLGPNLSGQTITLRFRLGTDSAVGAPGWRVDTITITTCGNRP